MSNLSGRAEHGVLRAVNEAFTGRRAARSMRDLAGASDATLRVLARHLDLPEDDAESVDFLRQALNEAAREVPGHG